MEEALKSVNAWAPKLMDLGTNLLIALVILVVGWWVSALLPLGPAHGDPFQQDRSDDRSHVLQHRGLDGAHLHADRRAGALRGADGQPDRRARRRRLAVGLALQGTLQNIAAGIMLLILRPVRTGEFVGLSTGAEGTVEEVGLFLTRLVQVDGIHITLPNSVVWNATITNYSRNKTRRLDIPVPVRYGDDLELALAKLKEIVAANEFALRIPSRW